MYSLAKAGFSQSYTYFTWRNTKADLIEYFEEICNPPISDFFRPNVWPNTPDILHAQFQIEDLAQRRAIFQQRVILAATLSANYGIYGPAYELLEGRPAKPSPGKTSSEEYLDSENISSAPGTAPTPTPSPRSSRTSTTSAATTPRYSATKTCTSTPPPTTTSSSTPSPPPTKPTRSW